MSNDTQTSDTEIVVDSLSDEELEDFTPIVLNAISAICDFSDKYNFDRNSMLGYLANRLQIMSEIATIEHFKADKGGEEMKDYELRMISEYRELKDRYTKLHKMIVRYDAKTLDFEPKCPIGILREQKSLMGQYLNILEVRAEIEGIGYDALQSDRTESAQYIKEQTNE